MQTRRSLFYVNNVTKADDPCDASTCAGNLFGKSVQRDAQESKQAASPRVVRVFCEADFTKRMILVDIHRFPPVKTNLYTYQNVKKPRFVDNMVDNVDKPMWISLTVFVHRRFGGRILTCGKSLFLEADLQEILPDFSANLCSVADKNGFSAEIRRDRME